MWSVVRSALQTTAFLWRFLQFLASAGGYAGRHGDARIAFQRRGAYEPATRIEWGSGALLSTWKVVLKNTGWNEGQAVPASRRGLRGPVSL